MKTSIPLHKVPFAAFLLLAALLPARQVGADTILLVTEESVDGSACPAPQPLAEGLYEALFGRGHIVFDAGPAASASDPSSLVELARSGGAAWILRAEASFHEAPFGLASRSIALSASWALMRAEDGATAANGAADRTNQGREREADRVVLAAELAAAIADSLAPRLGGTE